MIRPFLPAIGAALLIVGAAQPLVAQTPPGGQPKAPAATTAPDPVVASVNGQQVKLSDVQRAQQGLAQQYRQLPLQMIFGALLDQLIDLKLASIEGRKAKIQDEAEFKRQLAAIEDELVQRAWLQREIEKKITDEVVQERYLKKIAEMPAEDEIKARHILVSTEDEAKAIIAELQKGGDFEKIAREKSTDKASGAQGGDLGWFKKKEMVKEFADAAFALDKGATSATPVKTQFGFHVIKTEDRRPAPPPAKAELEDEIRNEVARDAFQQIMEGLRKQAKIERFNMDGSKLDAAPPQPPKN